MIHLFTSESVTCGHPDKVCDQIADRILDDILTQDSSAHVACEVTCAADQVHIFGEISKKKAPPVWTTPIRFTACNPVRDYLHQRT